MFIWPILLIAIVLAVVWYARGSLSGALEAAPRHSAGLDLLEERYARGEINRDEYLEKRRDLGATQ
ncbi:MAG TPA: SHOCT domain-containing protein [Xanthobacteraceae bacterium]|nr:SHOCT domain-containing protein [Xanthobacteraceae bacterium]